MPAALRIVEGFLSGLTPTEVRELEDTLSRMLLNAESGAGVVEAPRDSRSQSRSGVLRRFVAPAPED